MIGDIDLGDVPTWLAAATPAAVAIFEGRRHSRVANLGRKIEELVQTTADLADRILASPELEELVNRAVEDAARTTWQEKLDALASVVAAAIDGNDEAVSASLLVEAALSRLERPHAAALKYISVDGPMTQQQLVEVWPGAAALLDPILSVLSGEGLIRNTAVGTYDGLEGQEKWVLSHTGEELLLLLDPSDPRASAIGEIDVDVDGRRLTLTNTSVVSVRLYAVRIRGGITTTTLIPTNSDPSGLPLAPSEQFERQFQMIPSGPATVEVEFGERSERRTKTIEVAVA